MARPDIVDHPELRLALTSRHEFAHLAELAVGVHVKASPSMNAVQCKAAKDQQTHGKGQLKRLSREGAPERPLVVDHLVRRHSAGWKADVDGHHFALATRSVAESRHLRVRGAGGGEVAGNS